MSELTNFSVKGSGFKHSVLLYVSLKPSLFSNQMFVLHN
jgi:hypothetical protein